jgi:MscS family membrane protein
MEGIDFESIKAWLESSPYTSSAMALLVGVILAGVADLIVMRIGVPLTKHTKSNLDDQMLAALRRPIATTIVLIGCWAAVAALHPRPTLHYIADGILFSLAIVHWAAALMKIATLFLEMAIQHQERLRFVQPRTLPVFEISTKAIIIGGSAYFFFIAWDIDVTGWLASAGIVGIAVGFASKDTLANLFAGVFILADAPYKLGDYLVLDGGERGRVTEIGIRSTRILTRDDIEIIVPNGEMASSRIVNESGGPYERERVRCKLSVAYGSDIDDVEEILMQVAYSADNVVLDDPVITPRVRFRRFGDSGLDFELMMWIHRPEFRGRVIHYLNSQIYRQFAERGIEIPYPKRDVYLHHVEDE